MSLFEPGSEQLERRASIGRWQVVRASFPDPNVDVVIRHGLPTPHPEEVSYRVLNITGPGVIYHDGSATRAAWGNGFVRLRCNLAGCVADIELTVTAAKVGTTKLPAGNFTSPSIDADTIDGFDSTDFAQDAFKTIQVSGESDVVADGPTDTLEFAAGSGIVLTTNAGADRITIAATATTIAALDDIPDVVITAPADGEVLTYSAGDWINSPASGGAGALTLLEQHTASASASLDFTTWYSSSYDEYEIHLVSIIPASNSIPQFLMSTNGGSSYDTGNNYSWWANFAYSGTLAKVGANGVGALAFRDINTTLGTGGAYSGTLRFYDPGNGAIHKFLAGQYNIPDNSVNLITWTWGGRYSVTTAVNAFQFKFASGNITSGTIRIYGLSK